MALPVTDVVLVLEKHFVRRRTKNSNYSMRAYARDLGVSPSQLSRVLNRRVRMSYRQVAKTATALGIGTYEAKKLVEATIQNAPVRAKVKDHLRKKVATHASRRKSPVEIQEESVGRFKAISQWYHFAILELTYTTRLKNNPTWIAKALRISKIEAKNAVERLLALGYLELSEDGSLVKSSQDFLFVNAERSEPEVRNLEKTMILKAVDQLGKIDQNSFERRLINSITFPTSPEAVPELKDAIFQFQRAVLKLIEKYPYTCVYQLNAQLFPISYEVPS